MTMEDSIEELFGAVMTAMDPEGRLYSYDFRLLPSKQVSVAWTCPLEGFMLSVAHFKGVESIIVTVAYLS